LVDSCASARWNRNIVPRRSGAMMMSLMNKTGGRRLPCGAARRVLGSFLFALAFAALAFPGDLVGGEGAPAAAPGIPPAPLVFAAASMETALDAVAAAWKVNSGKNVSISYGSSAILAKQIEQGAPTDIFISADLKWMDYLEKAKLLRAGTRQSLFGNKLVLIEPSSAHTNLEITRGFDLAGAAGDGKIAVCQIDSCPGGIYAKEALESLGVFASVEPKLAQAENIRGALKLVARGEAKFGIVYATDAKSDPNVRVIGTFPESSHSRIVYPAALVASSSNPDAASFLAYLTSPAATKIFSAQGFKILSK
jgi:molybdate transport system substrate-binding protein